MVDRKPGREYQVCTRCVMDTTDQTIVFDDSGVCNHCRRYDERAIVELLHDSLGQRKANALVAQIKEEGKNKPYDCIIGVSGGIDSTMVAYRCKEYGLRPLAVHFDNGWNSELAVNNIEKILNALDIDLHTYVMDWEIFRDLQLAFLKASVANVEIPTDHAITALLFETAAKRGIRYIISGGNLETEGISPRWGYDNRDYRHVKAIHKRFGTKPLRGYPHFGLLKFAHYFAVKRIRFVKILNFKPFNKAEAKALLQREFQWKDYGGKHYESIWTRFFQGYYLPRKFGVDKRRFHLSALICSGQITREEALREMEKPMYDSQLFEEDRKFVLKKFQLTESEFDRLMNLRPREHADYPSNAFIFARNRFGLLDLGRRLATGVHYRSHASS